MFEWVRKHLPLPLLYVAFVLLVLYAALSTRSLLVWGLFLFYALRLLGTLGWKRWILMSACFALCALYWIWMLPKGDVVLPKHAPRQVQVVMDSLTVNGDQLRFLGVDQGKRYQCFYTLKNQDEQKTFSLLSQPVTLSIQGEVQEPTGQRNFNGFDAANYQEQKGIVATVRIRNIVKVSTRKSFSPIQLLQDWRRKAIVWTRRQFPEPMSAYMTGLLFGDLPVSFEEMSDIYTDLGILHLFALSGMQVGFFLGLFRWACLRMGILREWVDIVQIPFSFLYAGLTGFSVSVVRALLQAGCRRFGAQPYDALAWTTLALLFVTPRAMLSVGGQLTLAYAWLITLIDEGEFPKAYRKLLKAGMIPLGALPILLYHFSTFQPWSIPLTALFSYLFDLWILPLVTLLFLLSPLVSVVQVNFLFIWMEELLRALKRILPQSWIIGKTSLLILWGMLFLVALLMRFWKRKGIRFSSLLLLCCLLWWIRLPKWEEVTLMDVGQGDSILLRDRQGRTSLVDVGGRVSFEGQKENWRQQVGDSNAERTSLPYLESEGIDRIDVLVLTHTDQDHVGDLESLAQHLTIGEVWVSEGAARDPSFQKRLKALGIPIHITQVGDHLPVFDGAFSVLLPRQAGDGKNNDSIVLYGQYKGLRFLLTGDLEEEGEQELIDTYPRLKADVLKVGHHGSKGSSSPSFLDQLEVQVALISVGRNNRYHHPHEETLERLQERGVMIYRTDQKGAIRLRAGSEWTLETVRP